MSSYPTPGVGKLGKLFLFLKDIERYEKKKEVNFEFRQRWEEPKYRLRPDFQSHIEGDILRGN
ncbi:MAG: hypothetical protein ABIB61_02440 [Candidatus Shapirobacteria bacterium]